VQKKKGILLLHTEKYFASLDFDFFEFNSSCFSNMAVKLMKLK